MKKSSTVIVYTGDGKGKTTASLGLLLRSLGTGHKVAFIQFIKAWTTSEDASLAKLIEAFPEQLIHHKKGIGFFYNNETQDKQPHEQAARQAFKLALESASSGEYDLVICDEINNAVADDLLDRQSLVELLEKHHKNTSLCLTGRGFPADLLNQVDIATDMTKLKHHYDDGFLASKGLDF